MASIVNLRALPCQAPGARRCPFQAAQAAPVGVVLCAGGVPCLRPLMALRCGRSLLSTWLFTKSGKRLALTLTEACRGIGGQGPLMVTGRLPVSSLNRGAVCTRHTLFL